MASSKALASVVGFTLIALLVIGGIPCSNAKLSTSFYSKSCPMLFGTVQSIVRFAIAKEPRMGASLLRLFFHDCFVNGCDGSILLDDAPGFSGEKNAFPNRNSARGFEVIDEIKFALEKVCPEVVSCADVLAIAARDSVRILGGPSWQVKLGRRDSRTASQAAANIGIPPPTSNLNNLTRFFRNVGLSTRDMVALSGGHTIGVAKCTNFRARIYNESYNIDPSLARTLRITCPRTTGDNNLFQLDAQTPTYFDNYYFKNLIQRRGILHSDQVLYSGGFTDPIVQAYSVNPSAFMYDFSAAMIRMGDIKPLTGYKGEIRKNCRWINRR